MFPEHLVLSVIQQGIRAGKYLQGSFMASRENYLEGYVSVADQEDRVSFIAMLEKSHHSVFHRPC